MAAGFQASRPFVPPFPPRSEKPRGSLSMILTLRRNPLEIWGKADFERPLAIGRSILGLRAAAHDPAAVRRVFLDNAPNYRKDELQLRILSPGLGSGLLTAEGESWRLQRRSLAPLFSPRQVAEFAPAMQRVAEATVERLEHRRDGAVTDVGELTSRTALEVLEQTLFSQGLGREPSEFQRAVTSYFDSFGRLDPLDLIGAPSFLPRLGRLRGRPALEFFNEAVDAIVESRKAQLDRGGEAPRDLLTLLLAAKDPETGLGMPEADIRANIVTFIMAGHETTANGL
ncbi:MAG: cytochrome P450, partial [Hyphomicrobiales bacterium]|nr:cytochrome P450 [Hyphomicrobiales bacterium]